MIGWRGQCMIATVCILGFGRVSADTPQGTYSLEFRGPAIASVGKKKYEVCPNDERHPLPSHLVASFYSGRLLVDGEVWSLEYNDGRRIAGNVSHDKSSRVDVLVWREDKIARGIAIYWRLDAKGEARCATARSFSGTYSS